MSLVSEDWQVSTIINLSPMSLSAAVMDQTGKFASLLPASQGLGQIVGPNIAAGMLDSGMSYEWIFLMCTGMILIGMLVYLFNL